MTIDRLCWYVAEKTLKDLKGKEEFPPRVLNGMDALARFLIKESRIMERSSSSETARKDSKEQVPATIKDPTALAREFRWRVRLAAGHDSDDELETPFSQKDKTTGLAATPANGKRSSTTPLAPTATTSLKRKRGGGEERTTIPAHEPRFKGFIPRQWDKLERRNLENGQVEDVEISTLPTKEDGAEWFEKAIEKPSASDNDHAMNGESSQSASRRIKAQRSRNTDEIFKLRRTLGPDGNVVTLERETIRRVYESWSFLNSDNTKEEASEQVVKVEDVNPVLEAAVTSQTEATSTLAQEPEAMDTTADPAFDDTPHLDIEDSTRSPLAIHPSSGIEPESVEEMLVDAGYTGTSAAPPSVLV